MVIPILVINTVTWVQQTHHPAIRFSSIHRIHSQGTSRFTDLSWGCFQHCNLQYSSETDLISLTGNSRINRTTSFKYPTTNLWWKICLALPFTLQFIPTIPAHFLLLIHTSLDEDSLTEEPSSHLINPPIFLVFQKHYLDWNKMHTRLEIGWIPVLLRRSD